MPLGFGLVVCGHQLRDFGDKMGAQALSQGHSESFRL